MAHYIKFRFNIKLIWRGNLSMPPLGGVAGPRGGPEPKVLLFLDYRERPRLEEGPGSAYIH